MTTDIEREVYLLRDRLTSTEDEFALYKLNVEKALAESELKLDAVMRRLLAANDVSKGTVYFAPMRTSVLEHMNDFRRQMRGFFVNAGVARATDTHHRE